jgi:superoxide dismutase, Fe-Mn family
MRHREGNMDITNKEIKNIIKDALGLDDSKEIVQESFSAKANTFNLSTEMLSLRNKQNHVDLYTEYVDSFNRISAELDAADRLSANSRASSYRSLKIDETFNMNAIYLHEKYFENISDVNSEIAMDSISFMRLQRDFGTFDDWQKDFVACALSSRSGWAITAYNTYLRSYVNCFVDGHSNNMPAGCIPVIVMDVWQHAYYRDYLKDVKTYTYAMMKEIDWEVVEKRFRQTDQISRILET